MAITSLKPIKAKNKRIVIAGQVYERTSKTGYTRIEARGVFGSCHEYTDAERARIDDFYARRSGDQLAYYKNVHKDVPERMAERQSRAMSKVIAMDPR